MLVQVEQIIHWERGLIESYCLRFYVVVVLS